MAAGDGHTEAVRVEFDPAKISYESLLEVFWKSHVPMPGGRASYKSAIWHHDDEQREAAEASRQRARGMGRFVEIHEATPWHDAEECHQHYLKARNFQ